MVAYKNKEGGTMKRSHKKEALFVCPRCKITMQKIEKRDVIIDVCKKCKGMWLDDQEIEKLIRLTGERR
jgi:ribosomal protein L37AE/L43A